MLLSRVFRGFSRQKRPFIWVVAGIQTIGPMMVPENSHRVRAASASWIKICLATLCFLISSVVSSTPAKPPDVDIAPPRNFDMLLLQESDQ